MYTVLLSGGSGKRLWPLSNDKRSKQYVKFLCDENKKPISMIQRVWSQLKICSRENERVITAGQGQCEIICSQLGKNVNVAVEPERRDTFAAIAITCAYLVSKLGAKQTDCVTFLPVDPYADDDFFKCIMGLENLLSVSKSNIALLGVTPTYEATGLGYMLPHNSATNYIKIDSFVEKPCAKKAKELIRDGALWNCGVFCMRIGLMEEKLEKYNLKLDYEEIYKNYDALPKISFDYEVLEKEKNIAATKYSGFWQDIGTWDSLSDKMYKNIIGNGVSFQSENTSIINELDLPIVSLGCRDLVISASYDGILVSDKKSSEDLKNYVGDMKFVPKYEERRWGTIKVLEYNSKKQNTIRKVFLFPHMNSSYHYHSKRDEIWTVLNGNGEIIVDGIRQLISAGEVLRIPRLTKHAVKSISGMEFIEIQIGECLENDDINRITLDWNEIIYR